MVIASNASLTPVLTHFHYDTLGRATKVETPDANAPDSYAVTTTDYDFASPPQGGATMFKTTVTDPEGNLADVVNGRGTKISYKDVHDNIVAVTEYNKKVAVSTTYGYDLLGQIKTVSDAKGDLPPFIVPCFG